MKSVEITAKKVDDAIAQGLIELGQLNDDDVNVEVLDAGGLFRKAKVRLTLMTEDKDEVSEPPVDNTANKPAKTADNTANAQSTESAPKNSEPKKPVQEPKANKETNQEQKPQNNKQDAKPTAPNKPTQPSSKKPQKQAKTQTADKDNTANSKAVQAKDSAPKTEREIVAEKQKNDRPATSEQVDMAVQFIEQLLAKMNMKGTVTADNTDGLKINIQAEKGDDSLIIGRRGDTLGSIQYLTEVALRVDDEKFIRINLDCNGYRSRRSETLTRVAHKTADDCIRRHRRMVLEPMERIDRRTIHNALNDDTRIVAVSEGKEPLRRIVIYPADLYRSNNRDKRAKSKNSRPTTQNDTLAEPSAPSSVQEETSEDTNNNN